MSLLTELYRRVADLERRQASLLRIGTITELNPAIAKVRVKTGALTTDWIPWLTARAGQDKTWHAPEPGEQVFLLSPCGDMANAVALPALNCKGNPANGDKETICRITFADGAVIEYDRAGSKLKADIPGDIEAKATGNLTATIGGNVSATIGGNLTAIVTGNAALQAAAVTITAPAITLAGAVTIAGTLTQAPGASGESAATMQGPVTVTGDLTAAGVSLKTHTHRAQGNTAPTTPPL